MRSSAPRARTSSRSSTTSTAAPPVPTKPSRFLSNAQATFSGSVCTLSARTAAKGRMENLSQSSAPMTNTVFCRPVRISSTACPSACADDEHALENPSDAPLILNAGTRLM